MLWVAPYGDNKAGPKALMFLLRVPGQRWYHFACFGRKGHYYEDGHCEHSDALFAGYLTPEGKKLTKVQPFGGKPEENRPKRFAKRSAIEEVGGE
jgi:hypothetical protein